jgi:predicted nucleotidyltransferase
MTRLFTPSERDEAAAALVDALRADPRVADVRVFGSVPAGSADRHSDVDLVAIVAADEAVAAVTAAWADRVPELLPVLHMFSESFGTVELRGFLLEGFLEIDVAFAHADDWDAVPDVPVTDVSGRFLSKTDFIWHDVLHGAAAIDRGRPWRALFYIERLRNGTIELASLRLGLDARHHKQADELPNELRAALEPTLPRSLDAADLRAALHAGTAAFFAEARRIQPELADRLGAHMLEYLALVEPAPAVTGERTVLG